MGVIDVARQAHSHIIGGNAQVTNTAPKWLLHDWLNRSQCPLPMKWLHTILQQEWSGIDIDTLSTRR